MAELFSEVVLPESVANLLKERPTILKRLFGGGVNRRTDLKECYDLVENVGYLAFQLSSRFVRDDEMPRNLIYASRINYFIGQVLNGGVWQFLQNTGFYPKLTAEVIDALKLVGAVEHADLMTRVSVFIEKERSARGGLDPDQLVALIERLEESLFADAKLKSRYAWTGKSSWSWGERWELAILLCAEFIDGWKNIRIVPDAQFADALDTLAARIPDRAARRAHYEASRPWEKKAIERLLGLSADKIWYTAFSVLALSRKHIWNASRKKVWCWNFLVDPTGESSHHQAIFLDGELIIYLRESNTIVARGPAPECAVGSAVARYEPEQSAETVDSNSNSMIMIGND